MAPYEKPDHPDAARVDERMVARARRAHARGPRGSARAGCAPAIDRVHEVDVAVVLVRRLPVGPLTEAAQVGGEHHVARARRADARSRRGARRSRPASSGRRRRGRTPRLAGTVAVRSRGPRARARCGRAERAGTRARDIVASMSNTTRSRRYGAASSDSSTSSSSGTGSGVGPSISSSRRAGARSRHDRNASRSSARTSGQGSAGLDGRRVAASTTPTARSCARRPATAPAALRSPRPAPTRGRRRGAGGTPGSPTRRGSARGSSRTPGRHPPVKHHESGKPNGRLLGTAARRGRAGRAGTRSSTRASGRRSRNWYTSSCQRHTAPRCAVAGWSGSTTSSVERLGPRVAVEARADDRAVVVPAVARVGRGVDRQHREIAGAQPVERSLRCCLAPRRLTDGEERRTAGTVEVTGSSARARRRRVEPASPCDLGNLRDTRRGLVEHAVHARRTVAVRRDLRDEEQVAVPSARLAVAVRAAHRMERP